MNLYCLAYLPAYLPTYLDKEGFNSINTCFYFGRCRKISYVLTWFAHTYTHTTTTTTKTLRLFILFALTVAAATQQTQRRIKIKWFFNVASESFKNLAILGLFFNIFVFSQQIYLMNSIVNKYVVDWIWTMGLWVLPTALQPLPI